MSSQAPSTFGSSTRRLLPFVVAVVALYFVLRNIRPEELTAALRRAPLVPFLGMSAVLAIVNCAVDTFAMFHVFSAFGVALRFRQLFVIRAATYTLAVINYHAGQLGIALFLSRTARISLSRASAIILFIVGVWVGLLLIMGLCGTVLGGPKARALLPLLALFGVGFLLYGLLLRFPPAFLRRPPTDLAPPEARFIERMAAIVGRTLGKITGALLEAGIRGHLRALVVRMPHLLVLLVWHYLALRCFHIDIPVHLAICYLPLIFAAASLPISVQGLGISQMSALYFLEEFAAQTGGRATVLAYSLSMVAVSTVSNLLLGLAFMPAATRLGLRTGDSQAAPPASP